MREILPGSKLQIIEYAKGQAEYETLPAFRCEGASGTIVTRWQLSWKERLQVLFGGTMWLTMLTFNQPLQPVKLNTECPLQPARIAN